MTVLRIDEGVSADWIKAAAAEVEAAAPRTAYTETQPRDERGRWTSGPSSFSHADDEEDYAGSPYAEAPEAVPVGAQMDALGRLRAEVERRALADEPGPLVTTPLGVGRIIEVTAIGGRQDDGSIPVTVQVEMEFGASAGETLGMTVPITADRFGQGGTLGMVDLIESVEQHAPTLEERVDAAIEREHGTLDQRQEALDRVNLDTEGHSAGQRWYQVERPDIGDQNGLVLSIAPREITDSGATVTALVSDSIVDPGASRVYEYEIPTERFGPNGEIDTHVALEVLGEHFSTLAEQSATPDLIGGRGDPRFDAMTVAALDRANGGGPLADAIAEAGRLNAAEGHGADWEIVRADVTAFQSTEDIDLDRPGTPQLSLMVQDMTSGDRQVAVAVPLTADLFDENGQPAVGALGDAIQFAVRTRLDDDGTASDPSDRSARGLTIPEAFAEPIDFGEPRIPLAPDFGTQAIVAGELFVDPNRERDGAPGVAAREQYQQGQETARAVEALLGEGVSVSVTVNSTNPNFTGSLSVDRVEEGRNVTMLDRVNPYADPDLIATTYREMAAEVDRRVEAIDVAVGRLTLPDDVEYQGVTVQSSGLGRMIENDDGTASAPIPIPIAEFRAETAEDFFTGRVGAYWQPDGTFDAADFGGTVLTEAFRVHDAAEESGGYAPSSDDEDSDQEFDYSTAQIRDGFNVAEASIRDALPEDWEMGADVSGYGANFYITDPDGNSGKIEADVQGDTLHVGLMQFDAEMQGSGIGTSMVTSIITAAEDMGMSNVSFFANIDVGGYAWARMGAYPTENGWANVRSAIESRIEAAEGLGISVPDATREQIREILAGPRTGLPDLAALDTKITIPEEIPGFQFGYHLRRDENGQIEIGKALLLGTSWDAVMPLTDQEARAEFTEYAHEKEAEKPRAAAASGRKVKGIRFVSAKRTPVPALTVGPMLLDGPIWADVLGDESLARGAYTAAAARLAYNEQQPRDERGRWSDDPSTFDGGQDSEGAPGDLPSPTQPPEPHSMEDIDRVQKAEDWDRSSQMFAENRAVREAWKADVREAVATGQIGLAEARERWGGKYGSPMIDSLAQDMGGREWAPLPETLFHVTTAMSAVEEDGLKTRQELDQERGHGLGGGTSDTISFTADPAVAERIYEAMHEARAVAAGEVTVRDMLDQARRGERADRPYEKDIVGYWDHDWQPGQPYPEGLRMLADGEADTPDDRLDFYKNFALMREGAGGPMDPMFFLSDAEALARMDPNEIGIVYAHPVPGGAGVKTSALGEWRVPTGKAVTIERIDRPPVTASARRAYAETQPRDDRGRWTDDASTFSGGSDDDGEASAPVKVRREFHDAVGSEKDASTGHVFDGDPDKPQYMASYLLDPNARASRGYEGERLDPGSPPNAPGFTRNDAMLWARGAPSNKYVGDDGGYVGRPQGYIVAAAADRMGIEIDGAPDWERGRPKYENGREVTGQRIANAADHLLKSIRNGVPEQPVLWRGVRGYGDGPGLRTWKPEPGETVTLPPMSFSRSAWTASMYGGDKEDGMVLRVREGARGYAVPEEFYPWDQEVITAGEFVVHGVERHRDVTYVDIEQVAAP